MKRELIMIIDDVVHIIGRGVVVLGQIQNEKIEISKIHYNLCYLAKLVMDSIEQENEDDGQ